VPLRAALIRAAVNSKSFFVAFIVIIYHTIGVMSRGNLKKLFTILSKILLAINGGGARPARVLGKLCFCFRASVNG
jgi:hypothetical protein